MDDIYDNLENYEDVNALDELKTENKELKVKLEETNRSMERLQKEFEKLSSEFKKLEKNYSSLLRTAKIEIERKIQMINNLNKEKDALVISASQQNKKNKKKGNNKPTNRDNDKKTEAMSNRMRPTIIREQKEIAKHIDTRFDSNLRKDSEDAKSSTSTETNNKFTLANTRASDSSDLHQSNKSRLGYKENVQDMLHTGSKPIAVQSRRKSMPVFNQNIKLSSDEEFEQLYSAEENNVKNFQKNRDFNENPFYMVPPSNRFDRPWDEEGKANEYDYRRSRFNRFYNRDKSRETYRDRFDRSQHKNRQYSPDRYFRRDKECKETYQRADYDKRRLLESPPHDKYRYKCRDQQTNFVQDYGRQNDLFPYRHANKHKIQFETEGPQEKRMRTESTDNITFRKRKNSEKVVTEEGLVFDSMKHLKPTTCQSPDFLPAQDNLVYVKEIPNDVVIETSLEDPRRKTKNNEKNIAFKDELQVIDKSKWNAVKIPVALVKKPLTITDEMYNDIDEFNLSLESEPESETEASVLQCSGEKHKKSNKTAITIISDTQVKPTCTENDLIKSYVIPKLSNKTIDASVKKPEKLSSQVIEKSSSDNAQKCSGNAKTPTSRSAEHVSEEKLKLTSSDSSMLAKKSSKDKKVLTNTVKIDNIIQNSSLPPVSDIITCNFDVECKPALYNKNITESVTKSATNAVIKELIVETDVAISKKISPMTKDKNSAKTENISVQDHKNVSFNDKTKKKSSDSKETHKVKKEKTKRKESKNKQIEANKKLVEGDLEMSDENSNLETCHDKKSKTKIVSKNGDPSCAQLKLINEDEGPKKDHDENAIIKLSKRKEVVKSKFTDLFGDSSSLITPEDLEIPPSNIQSNTDDFFENAVDISVEDMIKVQSRVAQTKDTITHSVTKNVDTLQTSKNYQNLKLHKYDTQKNRVTPILLPKTSFDHDASHENEEGVVKTVIISTGVQSEREIKTSVMDNTNCNKLNSTTSNSEVKALATSTPERNETMVKENETVQGVCSINENRSALIPSLSVTIDEPECITDMHQEMSEEKSIVDTSNASEAAEVSKLTQATPSQDVPDVRIFVKRRRRVIKKAGPS